MTDLIIAAIAAFIAGYAIAWYRGKDLATVKILVRKKADFASIEIEYTGVENVARDHIANTVRWALEQAEEEAERRAQA